MKVKSGFQLRCQSWETSAKDSCIHGEKEGKREEEVVVEVGEEGKILAHSPPLSSEADSI